MDSIYVSSERRYVESRRPPRITIKSSISKSVGASTPDIVESAESAGLRYVSDATPGITRRRAGRGFSFVDPEGHVLKNRGILDRIKKLAVPPAYRDVWICPDANGHLQATGVDAKGRKQYRYHDRFREVREKSKYQRMLLFGRALPNLRRQIDEDLAARGLPKRKVLAAVVYLLERSLVRVGNEEYAKENKSFGLTTMRNRHVKVEGARIEFKFLGKSRVLHQIEIHDRRLARAIRRIQELPGQELFQFIDEDGGISSISSSDVNDYLREISGDHFTAKDIRTWWGSVLSLVEFQSTESPASPAAAKRSIASVMKKVAAQLGNTPSICRKCYVHPAVVEAFQSGLLRRRMSATNSFALQGLMTEGEVELLHLLAQKP